MSKTYLEMAEQNQILQTARLFKKNKFSSLVHAARYTLLAMYGDREAEIEARRYIDQTSLQEGTDPSYANILKKLKTILKKRVENQEWSPRVYPYIKQYHREGVPFSDYNLEPAPISQIKKFSDALYYAEEALKRIEALDLDGLLRREDNSLAQSLIVVVGPVTDDIYELCRLVTHPDMNLLETFGEDWLSIETSMKSLVSKASAFLKSTNQFLAEEYKIEVINPLSVVHQTGELTGLGLSHLKPAKEVNYSSVSYFSANLSSYLNQITRSVQSFATNHLADASYLNKDAPDFAKYAIDAKKLHALDKAAVRLASTFDNLYTSKLLQPANALGFAHILRSALTLVTGIIDEAGHFRAESENFIRASLAELKYKQLLTVLKAIDKIEEELMLRPGVLSRPLMNNFETFYGFLYSFVDGFVDLSAQGQDLERLEDSRFVEERMQVCFERQAEREVLFVSQKDHEQAIDAFFKLLLPYQNMRLRDLDDKVKKELITYFKVIRDDVAEVDIGLYNAIVKGLNAKNNSEVSWGEYLNEQAHLLTGRITDDKIATICHAPPNLQTELTARLQKQKATLAFQTVLNQDVMRYMHESLDTLLQHPRDLKKVASITNGKVLELEALTLEQTLALYKTYVLKRNKLAFSEQSLQQFIQQLEQELPTTPISSVKQRNRLRNAYTIFQPAMITAMAEVGNLNDVHAFDKAMIDALSGRKSTHNPLTVGDVRNVYEKTRAHFGLEKENILLKMTSLQKAIQQKTSLANETIALVPDTEGAIRATYLIKKPFFETSLNDLELKLRKFIKKFSPNLQQRLNEDQNKIFDILDVVFFHSKSLPFPEVEPPLNSDFLKQPKQLIGLKQLINCFYHLKEMSIQLEQLNNNSHKFEYVWRAFQIEQHAQSIILSTFSIIEDPHFYAIAKDLYDAFQEANTAFQTFKKPHIPEKTNHDSHLDSQDAVFYIMNSLNISKAQIDRWQENKIIDAAAAKKTHTFAEHFSAETSRLLASDTFYKWVMEIKTPFVLFKQIKQSWDDFAQSTTTSIQQNLEAISTEFLSDALIDADEWEINLGLSPGVLSAPLKQMFDAYYQGMIGALSNDSWHEIDLATSMVSFEKRIQRINTQSEKATAELALCNKNKGSLEQFKALLDTPDAFIDMLRAPNRAPREIIDAYNAFKRFQNEPQTIKNCQEIYTLQRDVNTSAVLDGATLKLQSELPLIDMNHATALIDISMTDEALEHLYQTFVSVAAVCVAYNQGLISTAHYSIDSLREQKIYIQAQRKIQTAANEAFEKEYVKKAIKKGLKTYQSAAKNLLYGGKLYDEALIAHIDTHASDFINGVHRSDELETQVKTFLRDNVETFDKVNFEEYQQYDALHRAVVKLKSYIADQRERLSRLEKETIKHTWSFESAETLEIKSNLVIKLENILNDKPQATTQLPIKERMQQFALAVSKPQFENELLMHQKYNTLSLSWLVQWLVGVLTVLKLYKPEVQIVHEHMQRAARDTHGLFAVKRSDASEDNTKKPHPTQDSETPRSRGG